MLQPFQGRVCANANTVAETRSAFLRVRWGGPEAGLGLHENSFFLDEELLQGALGGERHGRPQGGPLEMFVVDQRFADQTDADIRVLHLPDLACFKRGHWKSAFLLHIFSALRLTNPIVAKKKIRKKTVQPVHTIIQAAIPMLVFAMIRSGPIKPSTPKRTVENAS